MAVESDPSVDERVPDEASPVATASTDETVEVLEFTLADTRYCATIDYVAEVVEVDEDELTQVPNVPPYVAGIMDLRGQTTTIVDPTQVYDVESAISTELILVFDPEELASEGCMGWLVDEVIKVSHIDPSAVDRRMDSDAGIQGIINRDSEFLLWIDPNVVSDIE